MQEQPIPSPKANILVIDDTPENLYLLSSMLTERGYKVRSVTKGSNGLRGAQAVPPDLILLDIRMPEMDGYEVCQRLKTDDRTREIPVIFISASGEVLDKVKAFTVGGVDYITKPFQVEEVLARIETHLMLRQLRTQLQAQNAQLQQEIRERTAAEEKFTKAFRASPSPIAIVTLAEGRFIEVNPSFLRMSGYSEDEILHRTIAELSLMATNAYEQMLQHFQETGALQNQEFEVQTKSGETRTVLLSLEEIELSETRCILNMINDITEYKRLENEFISLVSHELRTPMNSLIGALDLLRTGKLGSLTDRGQQILEIAITNTERLIRLVNDILDLERIKSGKITMRKVQCQIDDLLVQAIQAMQPMAEQASVSLNYESIVVNLWADPDRLLQMLTNLLSNAIKFSNPGQKVWLRADLCSDQYSNQCLNQYSDYHSDHLQIQVADQGRGIPPEQIQRIFEPFQQVDASDSREKGGTGLGLAICRSIVEQHQGRIWVESTLGQGSIFHILLPMQATQI